MNAKPAAASASAVATQSRPQPARPSVDAILHALDDVGYIVVPDVLTPVEADAARDALNTLLAAEATDQTRTNCHQRVFQIAVKNKIFLDLMAHPLVVEVWKKYLGEDVICSTWSGNTLFPGLTAYDWHADYPYWAITPPWPAGNFTGQTIWLLDDFTDENGGTGVIPGSHRKLHPPDPATRRVNRNDAKIVEARKGSVVFLHGALWHSSRPNRANAPRSALLGMYLRPFCVPMENMRAQLDKIAAAGPVSDIARQLLGANQRQPG